MVRGLRFLDGVFPLSQRLSYQKPVYQEGVLDVRASRFLRPWNSRLPSYSALHMLRVRAEMESAALSGGVYHLWWHPHNMGRNMQQNFAQLDGVLSTFRSLRDRYGMESVTMSQLCGS